MRQLSITSAHYISRLLTVLCVSCHTTESRLFPASQFPFSPLVSSATDSNTASSPRSRLSSPMLRGRSFLQISSGEKYFLHKDFGFKCSWLTEKRDKFILLKSLCKNNEWSYHQYLVLSWCSRLETEPKLLNENLPNNTLTLNEWPYLLLLARLFWLELIV